jgi:hypothetical protein
MVSRLMIATQKVKEKYNNIYVNSKQTKVLLQKSILRIRFINISNLVTKWGETKFPTQKLVH